MLRSNSSSSSGPADSLPPSHGPRRLRPCPCKGLLLVASVKRGLFVGPLFHADDTRSWFAVADWKRYLSIRFAWFGLLDSRSTTRHNQMLVFLIVIFSCFFCVFFPQLWLLFLPLKTSCNKRNMNVLHNFLAAYLPVQNLSSKTVTIAMIMPTVFATLGYHSVGSPSPAKAFEGHMSFDYIYIYVKTWFSA